MGIWLWQLAPSRLRLLASSLAWTLGLVCDNTGPASPCCCVAEALNLCPPGPPARAVSCAADALSVASPVAGPRRWPSGLKTFSACVDAPSDSRGCLRDLCAQVQVLPCVRPVDAAISRLLACMEIADRVQIAFARSRRLAIHWFSRPRLLTVAPYLSTDLPCLPDASGRGDYAAA
jgi:hypothetical protein